jgi:peptidoglycan/LPS O-acetylase OafA/YrhL
MKIQRLGFITALDTLRFFAVLLVIVSHWLPTNFINRLPNGFMGVTFFFVLSGFLITYNLLVDKEELEEHQGGFSKALLTFYIRRTLRIFPLYYLVIFVLYVLNKSVFKGDLAWYLTYSSNILLFIKGEWEGMLSHFWSLAVEEQFYIIWPFLILMVPRRFLLRMFCWTIVLSVTYKLIMFCFFPAVFRPDLLPIGAFDAFGLGAILAYQKAYGLSLKIFDRVNFYWVLPAFVGALVCYMNGYEVFMIIFSYLAVLVIHRLIRPSDSIVSNIMSNPLTAYLGKISYGLYVYHNFIPWLLRCLRGTETAYPTGIPALLQNWHPSVVVTLLSEFILLVGIASISWFFFEKPLNSLKRYFR